jgi:hypothetical protein
VSTANAVVGNMHNHYAHNVPRSVCMLLGESNCPQAYYQYYHATTPNPPPPPHPPPHRAPPPRPPSPPPSVMPDHYNLKTLHGNILDLLSKFIGFDIRAKLNTYLQTALEMSPLNPQVFSEVQTEVTRFLQCDYNSSKKSGTKGRTQAVAP